ncbi:MAG TPA: M1 family peptidase, partial [Gemmatimonadales bacterium]|nr:M1 family peptidase [Gemmatimonadales bacterium]
MPPLAVAVLLAGGCSSAPSAQTSPVPVQGSASSSPAERVVRRDIPLTNSIRRAFAAGTRDSTGRPGPRYWQQRVDYTITA